MHTVFVWMIEPSFPFGPCRSASAAFLVVAGGCSAAAIPRLQIPSFVSVAPHMLYSSSTYSSSFLSDTAMKAL
jgi:hypothetical protein